MQARSTLPVKQLSANGIASSPDTSACKIGILQQIQRMSNYAELPEATLAVVLTFLETFQQDAALPYL
jgi:hypothetical protein